MGEIPCRDWAVGAAQVGSVNWRFLAPPTGCWHCGGAWSGGGRCARPPANVWHPYWGGSCRGASGWRAKRRGFGTGLWRRTSRFVGFVDACSTGSRDAEATSPQDPDWAMAIAEYLRSTPWCDSQAGSLRHDGGGPFCPHPDPLPQSCGFCLAGVVLRERGLRAAVPLGLPQISFPNRREVGGACGGRDCGCGWVG